MWVKRYGLLGEMMRVFFCGYKKISPFTSFVSNALGLGVFLSVVGIFSVFFISSFLNNSDNTFTFVHYADLFKNHLYWTSFVWSFLVISIAMGITLMLSLLVARVMLFLPQKIQVFFSVFLVAPIFFPSLIGIKALLRLLESIWPSCSFWLPAEFLMCIGYAYTYFPSTFVLIAPSFLRMPRACVEAARDLGCKEFDLWRFVFLPFVKNSISVALVANMPYAFFDITIPEMLGRGEDTSFSLLLWNLFTDWYEWKNLSVIVVTMSVIFFFLYFLFRGRGCEKKNN